MAIRTLLVALGAVLLAGVSLAAAVHVLPACAIRLPGDLMILGSCPDEDARARAERLIALDEQRGDLVQRIAQLEGQIAGVQCVAASADPNRPLDASDWREGDLSALYGCWDMEDSYRSRNVESAEIVGYPAWQMCFDTEGNGRQVMRDANGIACQGSVEARFTPEGALELSEPQNLACDDGGYIHRREMTCVAEGGARAMCDTLQPETNGQAEVGLRRAAREI